MWSLAREHRSHPAEIDALEVVRDIAHSRQCQANGLGTVGAAAGFWTLVTFVFTLLFGVAYNFFSGGIVSAYLGDSARSFWAACRRTFWSFTVLLSKGSRSSKRHRSAGCSATAPSG